MSICPRELQSMLHACQQWSIRNRMQLYTEKTKIMTFFETPALLRARGGPVNTSPAQPCPPFTCTHPLQPPTPARTLSTKSPNLSALAFKLFWIHPGVGPVSPR